MPDGVVGGGVEDDIHQLTDVEHCGRLKVKSGDDCRSGFVTLPPVPLQELSAVVLLLEGLLSLGC
jgi:hypothetical protein